MGNAKKRGFFLSPIFIIFSLIIIYYMNIVHFFTYFLVVMLHELAHFIVAKKLGYKLSKFYIMPYGVCLNYKDNTFNSSEEALIALAGPIFNFILSFITIALWWLFPETYYYLDYFCFCNLCLGAFNLIPCFPLDGGRVVLSFCSKIYDREIVYKWLVLLNYAVCFLLVALFFVTIFSQINFTFLVVAIFLFSGTINPHKYSSYNYLSLGVNRNNVIKNGANIKIFATPGSTPIYKIMAKFSKYKYNVVYVITASGAVHVLSEGTVNSLAIKYSPTFSYDEILLLKNNKVMI